jgi:hypothetical protein
MSPFRDDYINCMIVLAAATAFVVVVIVLIR